MSNEKLKPLIIIFALIALCAILSRVFSSGETLSEYAQKHPEKAYKTTSEMVTDGNAE